MTCIVVLLPIPRQQLLDLLYLGHMMSEGEELAPLLGVVALAFGLDRFIFVENHQLLYSCQLLIFTSSRLMAVKASINALARRTFVISGIL